MYDKGLGVTQNYAEALKWYHLAAAQGVSYAQYNLGVMYADDTAVGQDYVQALMWFSLAATHLLPGEDRDSAVRRRPVHA